MSDAELNGEDTISVTLDFDRTVIDVEALKRASFRYADKFSTDIKNDDNSLKCKINFLNELSELEAKKVINDFKIEVLDQDLRQSISTETADVRNAILAFAFSNTGLQDIE